MKKKLAVSEANFKVLPPAYNFINSNITNNTVFLFRTILLHHRYNTAE